LDIGESFPHLGQTEHAPHGIDCLRWDDLPEFSLAAEAASLILFDGKTHHYGHFPEVCKILKLPPSGIR
jgi:hypothetical protein